MLLLSTGRVGFGFWWIVIGFDRIRQRTSGETVVDFSCRISTDLVRSRWISLDLKMRKKGEQWLTKNGGF